MKKSILTISITGILLLFMAACSPEVGSEAWCEKLSEKPKVDWTANETKEYAKNCLFK